jgi:hypothetical protein
MSLTVSSKFSITSRISLVPQIPSHINWEANKGFCYQLAQYGP